MSSYDSCTLSALEECPVNDSEHSVNMARGFRARRPFPSRPQPEAQTQSACEELLPVVQREGVPEESPG